MQLVINEKNKVRINRLLDWFLYMVGYTIVFIIITNIFKSFHLNFENKILWSFIIELIIYILNKTIKPVLVTLTIPLTGLTLGLFYPFINLFILKLTDWFFGGYFEIDNTISALVAAILISTMNFIMERIIKKIIEKVKRNG